jgi:hypothetical protein
MVTHTCNPSYLWGRDKEDPGLRPAWQKVRDPHNPGMVICICNPSYVGDSQSEASPRQQNKTKTHETLPKNQKVKKGLKAWLKC